MDSSDSLNYAEQKTCRLPTIVEIAEQYSGDEFVTLLGGQPVLDICRCLSPAVYQKHDYSAPAAPSCHLLFGTGCPPPLPWIKGH